ncbi:hypothetical protein [Collinsella intestinalis]|uniref:hypothetical protein n=1 Tax=Collinsella intestinalis TaxID=147207 RepID=UPI000587D7E8|nr:hypothetical protein [Collinsella intestinalis]
MHSDSKTVRLHIDDEQLDLDSFKKCVDSFAEMIQALSDDAAPFARWLFSVERGSMIFNAELVTEEEYDLGPCFEVISGFVDRLASGRDVAVCPKKARDGYLKLASALDAGDEGSARAHIKVINGGCSVKEVPVYRAFEVVDEPRDYQVVGSVTGAICTLNSKRGNKFGMIDEGTGRYIKGKFQDRMLDDIRSSFKRRATVSGILTYRSDGTIVSIDARKIVVLPEKLPSLSSLRGILEA